MCSAQKPDFFVLLWTSVVVFLPFHRCTCARHHPMDCIQGVLRRHRVYTSTTTSISICTITTDSHLHHSATDLMTNQIVYLCGLQQTRPQWRI